MKIQSLMMIFVVVASSLALPDANKLWDEFYSPTKVGELGSAGASLPYCIRQHVKPDQFYKLLDSKILSKINLNRENIPNSDRISCKNSVDFGVFQSLLWSYTAELGNLSGREYGITKHCVRIHYQAMRIPDHQLAIAVFAELKNSDAQIKSEKQKFLDLMSRFETNVKTCVKEYLAL